MEPRIPVARPMSCASQTSVTPGKDMFSTKPTAGTCQWNESEETTQTGSVKRRQYVTHK